MRKQILTRFVAVSSLALVALASGCASGPTVGTQDYARMSTSKTLEYDMNTVWKATEEMLRKYKVKDREPEQANPVEIRKLTEATWETDWVYSQSATKFVEYKVNDFPRKKYLQQRVRYKIQARTVIGGVEVAIATDEEVQRLKADGTPDGYSEEGEPDSSLPHKMLQKIEQGVHAAPSGS